MEPLTLNPNIAYLFSLRNISLEVASLSNFGSHLHQDANLSDANPKLTQFWLW